MRAGWLEVAGTECKGHNKLLQKHIFVVARSVSILQWTLHAAVSGMLNAARTECNHRSTLLLTVHVCIRMSVPMFSERRWDSAFWVCLP